jgi:hypothetical protein
MRPWLLVPVTVIVPLVLFYLLQAATGDALSAIVVGLVLLITFGSRFAGRPAAAGPGGRY